MLKSLDKRKAAQSRAGSSEVICEHLSKLDASGPTRETGKRLHEIPENQDLLLLERTWRSGESGALRAAEVWTLQPPHPDRCGCSCPRVCSAEAFLGCPHHPGLRTFAG